MPAYRLPSTYEAAPAKRRASGLTLAVAVNLLLILVLLGMGNFTPVARKFSPMAVFNLAPESPRSAETRKAASPASAPTRPTLKPPEFVLPVPPTITPPPTTPQVKPKPWIELSKEDMAASNVSNLPAATDSSGAGDSEQVGTGPHGEVLYAAEWAREPTDAELSGYLPANAPNGFGLVACKTVPGNRVDDCYEIAQSPGSHLAAAVRQAAWQFRVRPPRKDGKTLVGQWVQIRIDYDIQRN